MKVPDPPTSMKWLQDAGNDLGDKASKLVNEDIPAAKQALTDKAAEVAEDYNQAHDYVDKKADEIKKEVTEDLPAAAKEKAGEVVDYAKDKYGAATDYASEQADKLKSTWDSVTDW
jgi:hypothetical protein